MTAAQVLRVVHVGAGAMGRAWLEVQAASSEVQVVAVVDTDLGAARSGAALLPDEVAVSDDLAAVLADVDADAVIDVTVPAAHHPVTTQALFAGLAVLGEKPAAATVAQGLSLAAASEVTGRLFMVSQSRRYNHQVSALRRRAAALGGPGLVTCEFFRAPRFGGFREQMDDVLLLDMAIHPFDTVRHLLGADPVSVYCDSFNPSWSWYSGDAAATAVFDFPGGERFVYTGSWCSPGAETSWNGCWRLSAPAGTALWDGDNDPTVDATPEFPSSSVGGLELGVDTDDGPESLAGALAAFVTAVRGSNRPHGEIHENLMSTVMVEAAIHSKNTRAKVTLDDVLEQAYATALADESRDDVKDQLRSWGSARAGLDRAHAAASTPSTVGGTPQ